MKKNVVVKCLKEIVGTDALPYISGEIENCGTNSCAITGTRGSIYGVAVKLDCERDKSLLFKQIKDFYKKLNLKSSSEWNSIGGSYYPLYWGKDRNMGIRIYSHTKEMKSTGTLQLCKLDFKE